AGDERGRGAAARRDRRGVGRCTGGALRSRPERTARTAARDGGILARALPRQPEAAADARAPRDLLPAAPEGGRLSREVREPARAYRGVPRARRAARAARRQGPRARL